MMVDSPGMIDSPMSRASIYASDRGNPDASGRRRGSDTSRGYDFEGVVRWFAERADVILFFFDPDKPGTTGETLSILCLLYTSPSPRDKRQSRMPSSA